MRRYHKILLQDAEVLTNLNKRIDATIELLDSVAS
jgi:hypothetical protein